MMLPRLSPMLLPLLLPLMWLRAAAADGSRTFPRTDPGTGRQLKCDRCPPGRYLRAPCTATSKSECAPCPPGSFTEVWNHIERCLRCAVCDQNQEVKAACAADRNLQCACKRGYYFKRKYDLCVLHSECPSGQGVLTQGTADEDTVCQVCPNGTFSDAASAQRNCTAHRSCRAAGLQQLLRGSAWHDSVCARYGDFSGTVAAGYLREILPAFFRHQNMHVKRLRHVLHDLSGKREAETRPASLPELHARLDAWLAAATADRIRQLPGTLRESGASGAAERLESKLRRIEANVNELSASRNEVDAVLVL